MKARDLAGSMCRFAVQSVLAKPFWNISALARASAATVTASSRSIHDSPAPLLGTKRSPSPSLLPVLWGNVQVQARSRGGRPRGS